MATGRRRAPLQLVNSAAAEATSVVSPSLNTRPTILSHIDTGGPVIQGSGGGGGGGQRSSSECGGRARRICSRAAAAPDEHAAPAAEAIERTGSVTTEGFKN